jgi:hypothetical protein
MDEMTMIRELLPEQEPPSPAVVAATRARLRDAMTGPAPARPRLRGRLVIAAVATGAAVAVGVATLPLGADDPGTSEQAAPAPSARELLLVAAERTDEAAADPGRFWHTRALVVVPATPRPLGTAPHTYRLDDRRVLESWFSPGRAEPDWSGYRGAGVRPASPADEAAWRAAGAPESWNLGHDAELGRDRVLSTEPDAGWVRRLDEAAPALSWLSAAELRGLPADEAALREFLLSTREPGVPAESWLFDRATALLAETPTSPEVRAAALRLIAGLDGVTSTGPTTDPLGRPGVGVTLRSPADAEVTLVVDPETGTLLARTDRDRDKERDIVVLSAGWTDEDPAVPSAKVP